MTTKLDFLLNVVRLKLVTDGKINEPKKFDFTNKKQVVIPSKYLEMINTDVSVFIDQSNYYLVNEESKVVYQSEIDLFNFKEIILEEIEEYQDQINVMIYLTVKDFESVKPYVSTMERIKVLLEGTKEFDALNLNN